MREQDLLRLDEVCRKYKVPLLIARSYGLVGYLRVSLAHSIQLHYPSTFAQVKALNHTPNFPVQASLPEHTVIESRPDNAVEDLR